MNNQDSSPKNNTNKWLILAVLSAVLVIILFFQIFRNKEKEEGVLRAVQCPACKAKFIRNIIDINNKNDKSCICPECGEKLSYIYKCEDCQYEFPLVEKPINSLDPKLKTMAKFQLLQETMKCPNCGSVRTYPISVQK